MTLRRSYALIALFSLLVLAFAWSSPSASAQTEADVERFGNWSARCQDVPVDENATRKVCSIFVDIRVEEDQNMRILSVAIAKNDQENETGAVIQTPLGTILPQGVALKVDENEQFGGPFLFCRSAGCEAHLGLTAAQLQQMRAGATMHVAFIHIQGGQIEVPVSLSGISAALDWLNRQ